MKTGKNMLERLVEKWWKMMVYGGFHQTYYSRIFNGCVHEIMHI